MAKMVVLGNDASTFRVIKQLLGGEHRVDYCENTVVAVDYVTEAAPDLVAICPGVRLPGEDAGDQKRVVTPSEAIANGADYIVVGRPIRDAENSVQAARDMAAEMEA